MEIDIPRVGQMVYVPTKSSLHKGIEDFRGGLCRVVSVRKTRLWGRDNHIIKVKENPDREYRWETELKDKQDMWSKIFGKSRGHRDPDFNPLCNDSLSSRELAKLQERFEKHGF